MWFDNASDVTHKKIHYVKLKYRKHNHCRYRNDGANCNTMLFTDNIGSLICKLDCYFYLVILLNVTFAQVLWEWCIRNISMVFVVG